MNRILRSERIKRPPKVVSFETYLREEDGPIFKTKTHAAGGLGPNDFKPVKLQAAIDAYLAQEVER